MMQAIEEIENRAINAVLRVLERERILYYHSVNRTYQTSGATFAEEVFYQRVEEELGRR